MFKTALVWIACSMFACTGDPSSSADAGAQDSGTDTGDTDTDTETGTSDEILSDKDVPYTPPTGGDEDMSLLDVYYRLDGAPKSLLVFVHGGSWVGGDKSNLELTPALIEWYVNRGFVLAAPNFRLASPPAAPQEVTYAEMATDVAFALDWLDEHGGDYGVTGEAVVLMGYSSGAHLVALIAADGQYLQAAGLSHDHLTGAMSFDVHAYDVPYALELMQGSELEGNIELIEGLFGETEAEQLVGSPASYVAGAEVPPSLLISADPSAEVTSKGYIARMATERHADLLELHGHEVATEHYDDETHSSLVMDFGTDGDGPTAAVSDFLDGLSL